MIRLLSATALLALLTACGDGQPFEFDDPAETDGGDGDGNGGDSNGDDDDDDDDGVDPDDGFGSNERLLPGTADPDPDRSIVRFEPASDDAGGFVRSVALRAGRLDVDNLAFDGSEPYDRARQGPDTLNGYAVFQSAERTSDSATGSDIDQIDYRAIYGESRNTVRVSGERLPQTRFTIVRSADFRGYGFGGFLYERNGGVEIPETGQAAFRGDYAGLRVFDGVSGQELTTGDMEILVDFADFNASDGVLGTLSNRRAFDVDGNEIEATTNGRRQTDLAGNAILDLPTVRFVLSNATSTPNGEIIGALTSSVFVDGEVENYDSGEYYGVLSGDLETGGEVTGVLVMESDDPRFDSVTAQETGGFTAYRD